MRLSTYEQEKVPIVQDARHRSIWVENDPVCDMTKQQSNLTKKTDYTKSQQFHLYIQVHKM